MWDPTAVYDAAAMNDGMAIVFIFMLIVVMLVGEHGGRHAYRRGYGDAQYKEMMSLYTKSHGGKFPWE